MAKDYETDAIVNDSTSSTPDDYSKAYLVIRKYRKKLSDSVGDFIDSLPKEIDFCNTVDTFNKLNDSRKQISSILSDLTKEINMSLVGSSENDNAVEIPAGTQTYQITGIVLKEYQILRYECERNILIVEKTVAETTKKMLVALFDGEGSNQVAPIQVPMTVLSAFGAIASKVIDALGKLLGFLDKMSIMNVKSSGCCFFITPKSMKKTDIEIKNTNKSLTNNIPEFVDKLLSEAEQKMKEIVADRRDREISNMRNSGYETAATGMFEYGGMGDLPKFDSEVIKTARDIILQTLLDADGLPRYEDLNISNIRFLTYLVTGFEPAAHKSFGIPGYA